MEKQNSKEVLMVFVKNPELGKAKTRLAKTVGDKKALDIYLQLLRYTKSTLDKIPQDKQVHYSSFVDSNDFWKEGDYQKALQNQSKDLGEKMLNAFQENFKHGYEKVIIIGSDCPEIAKETIQEAFKKLDTHDVVFGPAEDGGYYLLGMREMIPELFGNKKWSSDSVIADSIRDCKNKNLSYGLLATFSDVDLEEDWRKFEDKLKGY
ncbi:MAG: rSAM/selenodomain-associated transferase 1 [Flammeovirgaceae bacterium]|jgi:rSAM/selenodomain-associated transferase 1